MNKFDSFCSEMWLDHCDGQIVLTSADPMSPRLTLEEYKDIYMWSLLGIFYKREWLTNE